MSTRYPVYIISKGRWASRMTVKTFDSMGMDYIVVVEPQEYDDYAAVIDPARILAAPFSNLGQGSIPVRNFVWQHSIDAGAGSHWVVDDNIRGFYRMNRNMSIRCYSDAVFRAMEDFVDRYSNVGLAGPNYMMFVQSRHQWAPYRLNTRIYSCILVRNNLPFKWRGRYNEDTDLSIRVLKEGLCTVLFNAFQAGKMATMRMKGGNTDELYQGDGRLKMAESLVEQHPDVARVTTKWGRPQHQVYYKGFKQKLKLAHGVAIPSGHDDYGMKLVKI